MTTGSEGSLPVSGLHELLAEASGRPSTRYPSLAAARDDPDAVVALSGDDGGTVLLTAPLRRVRCDLEALRRLAVELDREIWDDPASVEVSFLRVPIGGRVPGGMGGGPVVDGVWVHPRVGSDAAERAEAALAGRTGGPAPAQ